MKTRMILIMALVIALSLPAALQAQETDPAAVVATLYEAFNAGDVDAIAALYADNAVVRFPDDDETLTGAEEIHPWIGWLVSVNFAIETESVQIEGNTVTLAIKTWADPSRELGVAPLEAIDVFIVKDGKITSQVSTFTAESNAKIQAALTAMPPPEALPESGGQTLPIYALMLAVGGLALLGGLNLALRQRR